MNPTTKPIRFNELMYGVRDLALAYHKLGDDARAAGTAEGGFDLWVKSLQ
jgi:hypothetical protein